jgi:S-(hydroxymethyl)glutathione dehydrogenase/alcohol dehydrogenase
MHDGSARIKLNGEPVNQMARIGTFSEMVVCPAEQLVAVRKDLPWTHAAIIGCSVATGVGAVVRHAMVEAGSSVVIVGVGGVGLNCVQGARLAGAKTIIAVDLLDNKLQMATQFGATHIINGSREDVVERVREITGGLGADYSFDAIGTAATTEQIIDVLAPAGHATIVGIPAVEARAKISPMQMVYSEKKVSGTYYGSIRPTIDFGVLADLSMEGKLDLNALISRTYKFDEINEGFQLMAKGQVARGVIEFN